MAVSEISIAPGVPEQELKVPLEGRVYALTLRWAGREARWYMDARDEDDVAIYTGVAIVLNFPLAFRCASDRIWPGALLAVDTSGANAEPTLDDLGARVKLIYFDSTELPIDLSAVG